MSEVTAVTNTGPTTACSVLFKGATGSAGSNGTSGTSGVSGTSGTSGVSGSSGTSGVSGSSGTSGVSGSSGTSGVSGTSGTSGVSGSSGTSGVSGSSGTSGVSGTSGTSGTSGGGGGGGLWTLLEEVTCASQTYIEFDGDGVNYTDLTDTNFEEFRIVFDGVVPSASGATYWYVIDDGSRITSGVYNVNDIFRDDAGNAQDSHYKTGNQAYVHAKIANIAGPIFGEMRIPRWSGSTYPMASAEIYHWNNTNVIAQSRSVGGIDATYSTIQGISLKRSTGNWGTSGSVKLYGRAA